jgi:hypothetical protein
VISSDPKAQSLRIDTAAGEIDIKSSAQLAPGTEVTVSLFLNKGVAYATVTILKLQIALSKDLEALIPPEQPPLKPGDIVTAIKIEEPRQIPSSPQAATEKASIPTTNAPHSSAPTIEQAVQIVRLLKPQDIAHIPLPPGIDSATLKSILTSPTPEQILRSLPPELREKIQLLLLKTAQTAARQDTPYSTRATPDNVRQHTSPAPQAEEPFSENLVRVVGTQGAGKQASTSPVLPTAEEMIDDSLLHIASAQMLPRSVSQSPSSPPLQRLLGALLPLIETVLPPQTESVQGSAPNLLPRALQPPQNTYQVRIIQLSSLLPENLEPLTQPATSQVRIIQGEVESITPRGLPVLRTDEGHFVLNTPAAPPVGTKVTFEATRLTSYSPMRQPISQPTESAALASKPFDPLTATTWQTLAATLETLEHVAPAVATSLKEALPALPQAASLTTTQQPPARSLTPPALLFLAALRLGDIESWLGEKTLSVLRATGHTALADRLTGDFDRIADQTRTPLPGGWKAVSMPVLHDENLSQLQFFIRRQDERDGGAQKNEAKPVTRFLLNLSLSRLGDMQLDGLIRQKQFDLILRTGEPLASDIRQEITQRFASGLDQTGIQGGVSFQARRQGWMTVGNSEDKGTIA